MQLPIRDQPVIRRSGWYVRERLGRGAGISRRHVGHAIMGYAFLHINRIEMRRGRDVSAQPP